MRLSDCCRISSRSNSSLRVNLRWVMSGGKNMPQAHSQKIRSLRLNDGICDR